MMELFSKVSPPVRDALAILVLLGILLSGVGIVPLPRVNTNPGSAGEGDRVKWEVRGGIIDELPGAHTAIIESNTSVVHVIDKLVDAVDRMERRNEARESRRGG